MPGTRPRHAAKAFTRIRKRAPDRIPHSDRGSANGMVRNCRRPSRTIQDHPSGQPGVYARMSCSHVRDAGVEVVIPSDVGEFALQDHYRSRKMTGSSVQPRNVSFRHAVARGAAVPPGLKNHAVRRCYRCEVGTRSEPKQRLDPEEPDSLPTRLQVESHPLVPETPSFVLDSGEHGGRDYIRGMRSFPRGGK